MSSALASTSKGFAPVSQQDDTEAYDPLPNPYPSNTSHSHGDDDEPIPPSSRWLPANDGQLASRALLTSDPVGANAWESQTTLAGASTRAHPFPSEAGKGLPAPDAPFRRERLQSAASRDSRLSLYEFHKPPPARIDADVITRYDWPLLILSILLLASSLVFLIMGGFELRDRPDVKKSPFNTFVLGSAIIAIPSTLFTMALNLERKWHAFRQTRKQVKIYRSSWSKRPILAVSMVLVSLTAIFWLIGGLGLILTQITVQPFKTRQLHGVIDDWVGQGRKWKRGEQLGAAIFTSVGGGLQIPVIMALVAMVVSTVMALVQIGQYVISKPESRD